MGTGVIVLISLVFLFQEGFFYGLVDFMGNWMGFWLLGEEVIVLWGLDIKDSLSSIEKAPLCPGFANLGNFN